ncbi:MAG: RecQ family ATP-dependent DNA helicase [Thermomicrobiales bacterium]
MTALRWLAKFRSRRTPLRDVVSSTPVDPVAIAMLRQLTGNPDASFRDEQWEVIDALVNHGEHLLLVQRTGWGKSAVYFIGTRLLRDRGQGPTIIVSPLLSLMRNQVEAGRRMGLRVGALHSGTGHWFDAFRQGILEDAIDILIVSPERFSNERFRREILPLLEQRIGMLVIDEAHCISNWGHDFRFDYLRLARVAGHLPPDSPLLATTATVNDRVVEDIQSQLGTLRTIRGPLDRENLALQVLPLMTVAERLAWIATILPTIPGQGIIYTLTKHDAETVAAWMQHRGIDAAPYHASLGLDGHTNSDRARGVLEDRFTCGELRVLVATDSLGMGYDNPGIRFVIHFQTPPSMLTYYQQVGRAGRGAEGAIGILMAGPEDQEIHEQFRARSLPTVDERAWVVAALREIEPAPISRLIPLVNMPEARINHTLRFLSVQSSPLVSVENDTWTSNPVVWDTTSGRKRDALIDTRRQEWDALQRFRQTTSECQMRALLRGVHDSTTTQRCGRCANCLGKPLVPTEIDDALHAEAERFLRRPDPVPIFPRIRIPSGGLPMYGLAGTIPTAMLAQEGRALTRWGHLGLGPLVGSGKHSGWFDDELVEAAVVFLNDTWHPDPAPRWVTCVPSLRHPDLVPDLARRIAKRCELPFLPMIAKVRDVQPQKRQDNEVHQCRNLDGAFGVAGPVPACPVLLVDDVVDSGWTFTVLAMVLRRAGSGPVFPFALATTKPGEAS